MNVLTRNKISLFIIGLAYFTSALQASESNLNPSDAAVPTSKIETSNIQVSPITQSDYIELQAQWQFLLDTADESRIEYLIELFDLIEFYSHLTGIKISRYYFRPQDLDLMATRQTLGFAHHDHTFPESLQGHWYMDGNPLADETLSLTNSKWDQSNKQIHVKVYDHQTFTWQNNLKGKLLYLQTLLARMQYVVQLEHRDLGSDGINFDEEGTPLLNYATIVPSISISKSTARLLQALGAGQQLVAIPLPLLGVKIKISPTQIENRRIEITEDLVKFDMILQEDGKWLRRSWLAGRRDDQPHQYYFSRMIDKSGNLEQVYSKFLEKMSRNYVEDLFIPSPKLK